MQIFFTCSRYILLIAIDKSCRFVLLIVVDTDKKDYTAKGKSVSTIFLIFVILKSMLKIHKTEILQKTLKQQCDFN